MAVALFTITSLREEVIDFTIPFREGSTGILTLSPGYQTNKSLFQILKPYSVPVWICVLGSVFVVGVASFLLNRFTPFQRKQETHPSGARYESSLEDNMWMVYSSVTEQGILHSPEAVSGRCLIGFWWLFTILLVATYTANLAAFLTVSLPAPPINTLGELLAQEEIQPLVRTGTSFDDVFKESSSKLYQEMWRRLKLSPQLSTTSELIELVETGKYALLGDKPVYDYIATNSCNQFSVATESFDSVGYGIVLPQGAAYLRTVNHLIQKMHESGLLQRWRKKWGSPPKQCRVPSPDSANNLELDSVGGLFFAYVGIIALACLSVIVEITATSHR
ncbi:glutamate receptor 2-like [Liolophura sinensis]|uniref:glutamate receptor 2-like n=1 Tax=Liolophura sinensis TaxID=3198878 RepID=UPI0031596108